MKKLDVLVLKSYIKPFVITFSISLLIIDMQFLWKYIDDLVGKGLEWYLIVELLYYATATFVPLALPLSMLISSLMTFGNLGEYYELVAIKASGISLRRMMKPLMILSVILSLLAFYFSNNVLPIANLKFQSLYYDIREKKLAFNIKEGIFYKDIDGYIIRVGKKDKDDIHIYEVLIYNHTQNKGNIEVTVAKSGKIENTPDGRSVIFTLYDGYSYAEKIDEKGYKEHKLFERLHFKEQYKRFDLSNFELHRTDEKLFKDHYLMLTIKQLNYSIDSLEKILKKDKEKYPNVIIYGNHIKRQLGNESIHIADSIYDETIKSGIKILGSNSIEEIKDNAMNRIKTGVKTVDNMMSVFKKKENYILKHKVVFHEKFTLSFACLALFFIGAPLGAIIRKGGLGLPVVISVVFFIIFHVISMTGKKYVLAGVLQPFIGMWLASAFIFSLGIFLTYKATIDAPVLDAESWVKVFQKIFHFKKPGKSIKKNLN